VELDALPNADTFEEWKETLKNALSLLNPVNAVFYVDDEDDQIRITSDLELEEFFLVTDSLSEICLHVETDLIDTPPSGEKEEIESDHQEDSETISFEGNLDHGLSCQHCQSPIVGIRYKCINCPNFNLCESCEESRAHLPHHLFVKIREPLPRENPWTLPNFYSKGKEEKQREKLIRQKQKELGRDLRLKEKDARQKEKELRQKEKEERLKEREEKEKQKEQKLKEKEEKQKEREEKQKEREEKQKEREEKQKEKEERQKEKEERQKEKEERQKEREEKEKQKEQKLKEKEEKQKEKSKGPPNLAQMLLRIETLERKVSSLNNNSETHSR